MQIIKTGKPADVTPQIAEEKTLSYRSFKGFNIKPASGYPESRVPASFGFGRIIHCQVGRCVDAERY